jgi:putative transposase
MFGEAQAMGAVLSALLAGFARILRSHLALQLEVLALRHQLTIFVLIVLAHARRTVIHFNGTEDPTAEWIAQQIIEAFPWDSAPKYLLRDRDTIDGSAFQQRVHGVGIEQVLSAPRSPWQNLFVERLIGTVRRDCLDHVSVLNEQHLRRIVARYVDYYHDWRTHLSLSMDAPNRRAMQDRDRVVEIAELGALHHHYERIATAGDA